MMANNGFVNGTLALVILASLSFYCAGLLMNDLADEQEDLRERPNRPLPSGAANRKTVFLAMLVLCAAGLIALAFTGSVAGFCCGIALVASMASYNFLLKGIPAIGALNMGLCRSLSVLLGGCVGELSIWQMALFPALAIGLYIAAVTNLARFETRSERPMLARFIPGGAILFFCFVGVQIARTASGTLPAAFLFIIAAAFALRMAVRLAGKPAPPLPPLIGAHIRLLLPMQAAFCYLGAAWDYGRVAAILLIAAWPVSKAVSRRFYAS